MILGLNFCIINDEDRNGFYSKLYFQSTILFILTSDIHLNDNRYLKQNNSIVYYTVVGPLRVQ